MANNFFQTNNNIIQFDTVTYRVEENYASVHSFVDIVRISDNVTICRIYLGQGIWWQNIPGGTARDQFLGGIRTVLP